ncbi:MAG: hypothetical protein ACOC7V_11115 [Spirochaetota bacterium]
MRRRLAFSALVVVLGLTVAGCHPLINPVDPNSTTFTGERTSKEPGELPRVLPEIIRWRIASENNAGQRIGLDIADDGGFIEPRSPANTPQFFILATFEESPSEGDFEGGLYVWAFADSGATTTSFVTFDGFDPTTNSLRLRVDTAPPAGRARIKIVDRNARVAGDVKFSFLAGDVNGDGVVDDASDPYAVDTYDGEFADESVPASVRADVNASGVVEGTASGGADYTAAAGFDGNTLTGIAFPEL